MRLLRRIHEIAAGGYGFDRGLRWPTRTRHGLAIQILPGSRLGQYVFAVVYLLTTNDDGCDPATDLHPFKGRPAAQMYADCCAQWCIRRWYQPLYRSLADSQFPRCDADCPLPVRRPVSIVRRPVFDRQAQQRQGRLQPRYAIGRFPGEFFVQCMRRVIGLHDIDHAGFQPRPQCIPVGCWFLTPASSSPAAPGWCHIVLSQIQMMRAYADCDWAGPLLWHRSDNESHRRC